MLSLTDVIEALKGVRPNWTHQIITDASVDSRKVIPGSLFVALPGERVDGHDYVADAFSRGACFALVQREVPGENIILDLRGDALPEIDLDWQVVSVLFRGSDGQDGYSSCLDRFVDLGPCQVCVPVLIQLPFLPCVLVLRCPAIPRQASEPRAGSYPGSFESRSESWWSRRSALGLA